VNVPGATVALDDREIGTAPLDDELWVEPAAHRITAHHDGYGDAWTEIAPSPGESREVTLALVASAPPHATASAIAATRVKHEGPVERGTARTAVIVSGGVLGAVALGVGIAFLVRSNAAAGEADRLGLAIDRSDPSAARTSSGCAEPATPSVASQCAELASSQRDWSTFRNVSTVGFVTGGLLGAATIAGALLWRYRDPARDRATVAVTPWVSAGAQGLDVGGRF
jgi:hypothetical protein